MTGTVVAPEAKKPNDVDVDATVVKVSDEDAKKQVAAQDAEDPWNPAIEEMGTPWSELDTKERVKAVVLNLFKIGLLLCFLYLFICSLSFLSDAFRLLGGKTAGKAFRESDILNNPFAGLMLGVLATVLVQSSSTSTSIVISMVASGIIEVKPAIFVIMGANIGTSVTNTIVSLSMAGNKNEFRRAFAGATVHDMFNWLTVLVLLPLEAISSFLYYMTKAMVDSMDLTTDKGMKKDYLKKLTNPLTKKIMQLDKKLITKIAEGEDVPGSLMKKCYDEFDVLKNVTGVNGTITEQMVEIKVEKKCDYIFSQSGLSDTAAGVLMLFFSLFILCTCLYLIVKLLHSMVKGRIAHWIRKAVNTDLPHPWGWVNGYVAMIVGAGITILVQSSSITTSTLTPLVGIGVISLERMYPLTLGANIGTTFTGVLAALASSNIDLALQVALAHLFFNIFGIVIYYVIPPMRKLPLGGARYLGNTTAEYRWFALFYIFMTFLIIPAAIFGISMAGWQVFTGIMVPVFLLMVFVIVVNVMQTKAPHKLPPKLQNWDYLPLWMRSWQPLDKIIVRFASYLCCCCGSIRENLLAREAGNEEGKGNETVDDTDVLEMKGVYKTQV